MTHHTNSGIGPLGQPLLRLWVPHAVRRREQRLTHRIAGALLALNVAAAPILTACTAGDSPSAQAGAATTGASHTPTSALPVGSSARSLAVATTRRTYRVYRPSGIFRPAPLVIVLHGALGSGLQAENSYGWDHQADDGHFVVAYPDGVHRTWHVSDGCCGPAAAHNVDDVAFIARLVQTLSSEVPVDPRRIYATGISNGGALAYRLACDTRIFAAIGAVSANLLGVCASPAPISLIHIHGTADRTFPYSGGPGRHSNDGSGERPANTTGPPIPDLVQQWRTIDHCAAPKVTKNGDLTTSIAACPGTRAVELITVTGAGHQWPGQPGPSGPLADRLHLDTPFSGLDATASIWRFFQNHPASH